MSEQVAVKIRIKAGALEIDCEASEEFVKSEIPKLLESFSSLRQKFGQDIVVLQDQGPRVGGAAPLIEGGVTTFAQKLNVQSGSDLIIAACARLTFSLNQPTFTRDEILAAMKAATGYYKKTYRANLSGYLVTLVKNGDLMQPTDTSYSLGPAKRKQLEAQLGAPPQTE